MPNYDLQFNPITRDMVFQPNGDFATVQDQSTLSTQNSVILLEARVMNVLNPAAGIGFNSQVLGGDVTQATQQLNRWAQQTSQDGGVCQWQRIPAPANVQFDFSASVSYPIPNQ
jgi:hypothetical protein